MMTEIMGDILAESSIKQELEINEDSDLNVEYQDYPDSSDLSSYSDYPTSDDSTSDDYSYDYSSSSTEGICKTEQFKISTIIGRSMTNENETGNQIETEENRFKFKVGWPFIRETAPPECSESVFEIEYKQGNERCVCSQWERVGSQPRSLVHFYL